MYLHHASFFVDPYTLKPLSFHPFHQEGDNVLAGAFLNPETKAIYPIVKEVPIFIKNRVPRDFYMKYKKELLPLVEERELESQISKSKEQFSFSKEWEEAHKDKVDTVWGVPVEERLQMHYSDTETAEEDQKGKLLLDVGCGNGILCKALAEKGATVFGIDYSTSVWNAQERMKHPSVCFLQADLHYLPFKDESFDIVYSNGVLHHTSHTENAFKRVSTKVKPKGKYYVWLYKRSESFSFNVFLYGTDFMRFIVNKLPFAAQEAVVEFLLWLKIKYNKLRTNPNPEDIAVARTNLYDTLTPKYKYYHTVDETQGWFLKYGFENPRMSHLNIYGFGVLGEKK